MFSPPLPRCIKSCNGFAHSNGEVRDAARELTVELHALVGEEVRVRVVVTIQLASFVDHLPLSGGRDLFSFLGGCS